MTSTAPSPAMMRRRALTSGTIATAGVAATAAHWPAAALAVIAAYVLIGAGRAGWRHPRWFEPVVSGALACVAAVLSAYPSSWWALGFVAVAVVEALRAVLMARREEDVPPVPAPRESSGR